EDRCQRVLYISYVTRNAHNSSILQPLNMRLEIKLRPRLADLKYHAFAEIGQDNQPENEHRNTKNLIALRECQHPAKRSQQAEKKTHAAVLGHISCHQLGFRFGNIERRPVAFSEGRREVEEKGREGKWIIEEKPIPRRRALSFNDTLHAQSAGKENDG